MSLKRLNINKFKKTDELSDACVVLESGYKRVSSLHKILKKSRKGKRGGKLSDKEQDLLRAMLLFSSSSLDAVIKQLVEDSLSLVIKKDEGAFDQFKVYIGRRLKKSMTSNGRKIEDIKFKFLANILAQDKTPEFLANEMVKSLTDNSLQSTEELLKVASHFAIKSDEIIKNKDFVDTIFDARNEIVHEMDMNLGGRTRNTRYRRKGDMMKYINRLLKISSLFIEAVFNKLK